MSPSLPGDQTFENRPSIEAKALRINLNQHFVRMVFFGDSAFQ